jgi:plastocyanin
MPTRPSGLTSAGWWRTGAASLLALAPLVPALLAASACASDKSILVNADGTFTPSVVEIQAGDTIQWVNLSTPDAIVQIGDPNLFPSSDPCGIADSDLDHAFAAEDPNEFTGPPRKGVSGIFVLGQDGPGLTQRLSTETCSCELLPPPMTCTPRQVLSLDGNSYKLCSGEGATHEILEATWANPDVTGVILRLDWSSIQVDDNGVIEFVWADLDREMDRAVESGKLFTLDVSAGKEGTPEWIFRTYAGPAGPGPVVEHTFKDWGSEPTPPYNNCGYDLRLGSPADACYRELYVAMIEGLAAHVASDSRWFQALAHVKVSGANFLTSEARLPNRCYDGDLDTIGQDDCLCNSKVWAVEAGYTPAKLYRYFRGVGNAIYAAFHQRKSLGYQLIQDGFPSVESATNFEGDSLLDQSGMLLLDPPGTTLDDPRPVLQTLRVLQEGREGRFADPTGDRVDTVVGKLFVPQHSGLGRLPDDDGRAACSQAAAVDPVTQQASFPIPTGTAGGSGGGCPNRWAVDEGTIHSQIMGFQTGNPQGIGTPADVESALWNLTINSNGVFLELYEQLVWEIFHTLGTGSGGAALDPARASLVVAPYSKSLHTWTEELHQRREALAEPTDPHLAEPFPEAYLHTFAKAIAAPETYYYINPAKCALTTSADRVGQITVVP